MTGRPSLDRDSLKALLDEHIILEMGVREDEDGTERLFVTMTFDGETVSEADIETDLLSAILSGNRR